MLRCGTSAVPQLVKLNTMLRQKNPDMIEERLTNDDVVVVWEHNQAAKGTWKKVALFSSNGNSSTLHVIAETSQNELVIGELTKTAKDYVWKQISATTLEALDFDGYAISSSTPGTCVQLLQKKGDWAIFFVQGNNWIPNTPVKTPSGIHQLARYAMFENVTYMIMSQTNVTAHTTTVSLRNGTNAVKSKQKLHHFTSKPLSILPFVVKNKFFCIVADTSMLLLLELKPTSSDKDVCISIGHYYLPGLVPQGVFVTEDNVARICSYGSTQVPNVQYFSLDMSTFL